MLAGKALSLLNFIKAVSFAVLLCIFANSCMYDCVNNIHGIVCDMDTKRPVSGANVALIVDGKVFNDYAWITDTMRSYERQEYIKKHGNHENWVHTSEGDYTRRMQRKGPLLTDSLGRFKITFLSGLCIPVKFVVSKPGYLPVITKEMKLSGDTINLIVKKIK